MTGLRYRFLLILLLLSLPGCANLPFISGGSQQPGTPIPEAVRSPTAPATPPALETLTFTTPDVTSVATQQTLGAMIRIWLPPEFDLEKDAAANRLLNARLEDFETEHPEVKLEVRIKDLNGPGGMLESLAAANVSAPLALPDLVLLSRPALESAALKDLLTPYDSLSDKMEDPSWFNYAQELARIKTSIYGLPFAGDASVLAYKPSQVGVIPQDLDALTALGGVLIFPASDPQALFTLSMYLDGGGTLEDEQGRPYLDKAILIKTLQFEQEASLAGVMPYWLTQYSNDEQVWEAFTGDQYPMAVTWASVSMQNKASSGDDLAIAPVPTWDGSPFTLANGWSWALSGQDPDRRLLATQLAEYLVEQEFIGAWTFAAGYLPPRADALQTWQDGDLRQMVQQISSSAQLMPPTNLTSSLGPELEQAVVKVLKAENDAETAAQAVIDQVNQP